MRALACAAALFAIGCFPTRMEGTIESRGPAFGDWSLAPTDCSNGALVGFFGVDLWDASEPGVSLRLLEEPVAGRIVIVDLGGSDSWILESQACERHRVNLRLTNKSVNDVRLVDGSLDLECDYGPEGSLRGRVEFKNCRGDSYFW